MIGLGIETSCDETSVAIVRDGKEILSLQIYSQIDIHSAYNGVVPEIASRAHLEKINLLFAEAMKESSCNLKDLEYVAVSSSPGLVGSLLIGAQFAKCVALVQNIPLLPVCHLQSHMAAILLEGERIEFPSLGILLSGGNSAIFRLEEFGNMTLVGDTMDDALGEAFDKVAKLLNLPYPGGPSIEKLAKSHRPKEGEKSYLPVLLRDLPQADVNFSFSGLKTSVLYFLQKHGDSFDLPKLCFDFQNSAFELVERNLVHAVRKTGVGRIILAGGVAANGTLQERLKRKSDSSGWKFIAPKSKILCTDNAAMVAALGYQLHSRGYRSSLDFAVSPNRQERFN